MSLSNMNGGSALNYLMLGFFNIIWIPTAMKFGRKIVYILSLVFVLASGIWGGVFSGVAQYYIMMTVNGIGTAAYQALIQLTVRHLYRPSLWVLMVHRSLMSSSPINVAECSLSISSSSSLVPSLA